MTVILPLSSFLLPARISPRRTANYGPAAVNTIAYGPNTEFFFSIKACVRPHGSYVENFPMWWRRFEILCSSSRNNISRLRAANLRYIVLSRNSLKIFRSNRVFFQVLSLSCCLENASISLLLTIPYHNKHCSSHLSMQQANQVHSAKFERWEA